MIVVETLSDPKDLAALAIAAETEGYRFVNRLITDWQDGSNRFSAPGEIAFVAKLDEEIVGVCGLNQDPYVADPRVGRVRHLYVSPMHRRAGVGGILMEHIVGRAEGTFSKLRLRTRNPRAADFYRYLGFVDAIGDETCTHELMLNESRPRRPSRIS